MKPPKKLWSTPSWGSKVVRIDADVFKAMQKIAIERGMQSSTPGQVLRKMFEESGLMRDDAA